MRPLHEEVLGRNGIDVPAAIPITSQGDHPRRRG